MDENKEDSFGAKHPMSFDNFLLNNDYINYDENIKEYLTNLKDKFNNVNPLRIRKSTYAKYKLSKEKKEVKKTAILELVTNLKAQYIISNVRVFVKEYLINTNEHINTKIYINSRRLRNFCLYFMGIVMIFERPWFCYDSTTIPLPNSFKFIKDCKKKVVFLNVPFLNNYLIRIIEIIQNLIIFVTQILKYKDEYNLKNAHIGINKCYNSIQLISILSLLLSVVDLIYAISTDKFPIINFLMRPFIFILLLRRLRQNWIRILKVLWKTKRAYFLLFVNMMTFSIIGYALFKKKDGFFKSYSESLLQLYILLSTCNFPDIMLEAMEFSKFSIIYFILYISINYFFLLSYLSTLYTTKYYEVNKKDCLVIIRDIIGNKYNKYIFYGKKFCKFILKQKNIYSLNDDEFKNILILFDFFDNKNNSFQDLINPIEITPEKEMKIKFKFGKFILNSKSVELLVNFICIIDTVFLFGRNNFFISLHFIISFLFLYEIIILIKNLRIKRFICHHFNRFIFHIFNIVVMIYSIYLFTLDKDEKKFDDAFKILRIFVSLRTIRILVFIDKFRIIKNIYIIIQVSKEMLYRNLLVLYSFFLIFSTLTMLLTGGNIKNKSFSDESDSIPNGYEYINFNDFGSSFISCFCLMMINNLNILVKSLTYESMHQKFFQFYFATFYFFSTLIIINIIQTLLLQMYLISDNSLTDKRIEEEKIIREQINKINDYGIGIINN